MPKITIDGYDINVWDEDRYMNRNGEFELENHVLDRLINQEIELMRYGDSEHLLRMLGVITAETFDALGMYGVADKFEELYDKLEKAMYDAKGGEA